MTRVYIAIAMILFAGLSQAAVLKDFDGKIRQIAEFKKPGKWLVVMIWAHDCPVCNNEAPNYVKFHGERHQKDVVVLGISADGKNNQAKAKAFIERHKINFPNLIGELHEVVNMYMKLTGDDRFGTPSFLVYSPKGELVAGEVGGVPPTVIDAFIKDYNKKAQGSGAKKTVSK